MKLRLLPIALALSCSSPSMFGEPPTDTPDLATPDFAGTDLAVPDLATPDLATPDFAMPDFAMPDFATPDFALPDLVKPDLARPDLSTPDFTLPPDLTPPPDLWKPDLMPPPPSVSSVTPTSGPTSGGTAVTISGANFATGAKVYFGGTEAKNVSVSSAGTTIQATTPTRTGQLGKTDVVVTNPDTQSSTLPGAFLYYAANVGFGVMGVFPFGAAAYGVVAGDLDGDKHLDVLVAPGSPTAATAAVLLGDGQGDLTLKGSTDAGGVQTYLALLADVDGDKKLDALLLHGATSSATVSLVLGAGNGTFGAPTSFPAGAFPGGLGVGDLDGDAKLDYAVSTTTDHTIATALGDGKGGFGALKTTTANGTQHLEGLALCDFNGDAKLDVVVAVFDNAQVRVYRGLGDGTFASTFAAGNTVFTQPTWVTCADFNNDGAPDIAVSSQTAGQAGVLLNDRNGALLAIASSSMESAHMHTQADFNGDGWLDLVGADDAASKNVTVLLNNGSQQNGGVGFTSKTIPAGASNWSVDTGDFDGDGKIDIVAADEAANAVTILLNRSQ